MRRGRRSSARPRASDRQARAAAAASAASRASVAPAPIVAPSAVTSMRVEAGDRRRGRPAPTARPDRRAGWARDRCRRRRCARGDRRSGAAPPRESVAGRARTKGGRCSIVRARRSRRGCPPMSCRRSARRRAVSASSRRSGEAGNSVRRSPVASAIALVSAGRKPESEPSPASFAPNGPLGSGASTMNVVDRRRLDDRRHAVVEQVRAKRQALVVLRLLGQRLSHSHPHRALDLALDGERVDRAAAVVRDPDAHDAHHARCPRRRRPRPPAPRRRSRRSIRPRRP